MTNPSPEVAAGTAQETMIQKPDPRWFDEQGNYRDGPHYGKDCPKGKVQIAFLGIDPKLQCGPYTWKPTDHAWIEVAIDGETWRIDIGDYEAAARGGKRRGIHINGPIDLCVDKHSLNALDVFVDRPALPSAPAPPQTPPEPRDPCHCCEHAAAVVGLCTSCYGDLCRRYVSDRLVPAATADVLPESDVQADLQAWEIWHQKETKHEGE